HGEPITRWVNVSPNHIAFGRGNKGYVAINRTNTNNTRTYTTSLPSGYYCDVTQYAFVNGWCVNYLSGAPLSLTQWIRVHDDGTIQNWTLNAMDAFAVHVAASRHEVSLNAVPAAGGSVSGSGTYTYGQMAVVTATPGLGYFFVRWEDATGTVATTPVYTFPVTANRVLTAVFAYHLAGIADLDNAGTTKAVTPTAALMGDVLTYTLTLSSSAPVTVTAHVTDALPVSLTLLSATPGYVLSGTTLSWSGLSVPPYGTVALTITVRAGSGPLPAGYVVTNTAQVGVGSGVISRSASGIAVAPWRAFVPLARRP
ncbi:MAG: alpha amylase C-terminal domain-containing protein, partial [Thermoflexales bacterium]|nr:alpha amylase C-terminal domain-containing protein [Thermoflexales bacterium]